MTKPYYSDYVRHCLRFYTRNLDLAHFKSEADKSNWLACASVLKTYEEKDRTILIEIYSGYDTLADNVYEVSKKHNVNQAPLWDMMKELERKIARKRGLM